MKSDYWMFVAVILLSVPFISQKLCNVDFSPNCRGDASKTSVRRNKYSGKLTLLTL